MTFEDKMRKWGSILKNLPYDENYECKYNKIVEKMAKIQYKYMHNVMNQINTDTEAGEVMYYIVNHAVDISTSGNSIAYVDTKELAVEVEERMWSELGDYLLDSAIYQEYDQWAIDCMFGGFYVPYWDGYTE